MKYSEALVQKVANAIADFNACGACAGAPPYCAACWGEAVAALDALGLREERNWGFVPGPGTKRRYVTEWEDV